MIVALTQQNLPKFLARSQLPCETPASTLRAMLDIRLIREKPDYVRERLATRGGGDERNIDELLQIDAKRRKAETALQQLNADRKRLSKEIGAKAPVKNQI